MNTKLESPLSTDKPGIWLKGNLHCHTTLSDGRLAPQEIMNHYASLGYDFLAISDHDKVWENRDNVDSKGMVLLPANEITTGGSHVLHVGSRTAIKHQDETQGTINLAVADSGFVILPHPNWQEHFNHYPADTLLALKSYVGIEVFNGMTISGEGNHLATDKWDRLLSAGLKVIGFANDDTHSLQDIALGWNVVRVAERSPEAILDALRTGSFYASSGVEITELTCDGPTIRIVAPKAQRIFVIGVHSKRVHASAGSELSFDVSNTETPFVRLECHAADGSCAWTQPIFIKNGRIEAIQNNFRKLENAVLVAKRVDRKPKMTGLANDPVWSGAKPSTNFRRLKTADDASVQTEMKAIVSGDSIFLAFNCQEPCMDKLKITPRTTDGDKRGIWNDDSVEIFIAPPELKGGYWQILAAADGDSTIIANKIEGNQTPEVTVVANKSAAGWQFEMEISLAKVKSLATAVRQWGFHVCRNRMAVRECLISSPIGTSNHAVAKYGKLSFE